MLLGDVADLHEALLRHVQHKHLVGDAKAVLGVREGSLSELVLIELQAHVDKVRELLRTRRAALFVHLPDKYNAPTFVLRDVREAPGNVHGHGDAPDGAYGRLGVPDGLRGVDDHKVGVIFGAFEAPQFRAHVGHVRSAKNAPLPRHPKSLRALAYLRRVLFCGDVQYAVELHEPPRANLEKERRLARSVLARKQVDGIEHEPAAEYAVESLHERPHSLARGADGLVEVDGPVRVRLVTGVLEGDARASVVRRIARGDLAHMRLAPLPRTLRRGNGSDDDGACGGLREGTLATTGAFGHRPRVATNGAVSSSRRQTVA